MKKRDVLSLHFDVNRLTDENGSPLSPEELDSDWRGWEENEAPTLAEEVAVLPEKRMFRDTLGILDLVSYMFSPEELTQWIEKMKMDGSDERAIVNEIINEFKRRQVESLKSENLQGYLERMSRHGQMSIDEWSWSLSIFAGCEAILCELDPDFDLETISDWSDHHGAIIETIKRTLEEGTHPKAQLLRKAQEGMGDTLRPEWEILAFYDAALGATEKWRLSTLEKAAWIEKRKKQRRAQDYTLRELMRYVKRKRATKEGVRAVPVDEGSLARLSNTRADHDLRRSLMAYPNWPINEQLANRYHKGKNGHTVVYQPSEVERALGNAPQLALDALDRRFNQLRSETVADVIDILFHHWNTHKDTLTSAVPINAAKICEYRGIKPEGDNLRLHWEAMRDAFSITLQDTKSDINAKVFNADSKGEIQDGPGARYAYRPGIFLEYALRGEPLYFAPFLQTIWALDPKRNNEAKRLARYLRGDWRMNTEDYLEAESGKARAARWRSWAAICEEMGEDVEKHRKGKDPSRLIEKMARAVETLYQLEAIAEGGFDIYHPEDRRRAENLPRRGALDEWLSLRVCMAPGAKLREALLQTDAKRRAGRERDAKALSAERARKRLRAEEKKTPQKPKKGA